VTAAVLSSAYVAVTTIPVGSNVFPTLYAVIVGGVVIAIEASAE
jgi:hypothetical protein